MKKIIFLLCAFTTFVFANNTKSIDSVQNEPQVGTVLIINATSNTTYNHIKFPKLNTIAKRGHLANYKSVHGKRVVVKEIIKNNQGLTHVLLEKEDKTKFFGFQKQVKANYTKAIAAGELLQAN
ncbi:hypothetical protein [Mariniflexile maritimum]|uniref:hypothetical protein n=1 Tax=Mariniflexile maritimum TaxID=2682493 RepID=UPI0012F6FE2E|nr:hypothetical protein [Mariniflexile maritimum]